MFKKWKEKREQRIRELEQARIEYWKRREEIERMQEDEEKREEAEMKEDDDYWIITLLTRGWQKVGYGGGIYGYEEEIKYETKASRKSPSDVILKTGYPMIDHEKISKTQFLQYRKKYGEWK